MKLPKKDLNRYHSALIESIRTRKEWITYYPTKGECEAELLADGNSCSVDCFVGTNIQDEPKILEQGKEYIVVQRGDFKRRIDLFKPTPFSDDLILQKLIGDGDKFPRDFLNSYAAGLSGTPPRLAYERGNIAGSQLKITNTGPFKDKPILIVTADHDRDHTDIIDGAIVDWLQEIGAAAEFCYLPDREISGNGHMMMLEKNSNDIAVVISKWIDSRVSH